MTDSNKQPPADDDLDEWLDQLAGRRPGTEETDKVRAMIQRARVADDERLLGDLLSPEAEARAVERLRFRLRAEGLAGRPRPWQRWKVALPAAAAAALMVGIGVRVWQPTAEGDGFTVRSESPPILRGDIHLASLVGPNPLLRAKRLAAEVAPFDSRPAVYVHEGQAIVDFEVSSASQAKVLTAIADPTVRAAVKVGLNRINFKEQ